MTNSKSLVTSEPQYNMDRRISVVMTRQGAVAFICKSPVRRPTSPNILLKSLYFWLDSALIGDVYIALKNDIKKLIKKKITGRVYNGSQLASILLV